MTTCAKEFAKFSQGCPNWFTRLASLGKPCRIQFHRPPATLGSLGHVSVFSAALGQLVHDLRAPPSNIQDLGEQTISDAFELSKAMAEIHPNEDSRNSAFQKTLSKYVGTIARPASTGSHGDAAVLGSQLAGQSPLLIHLEIKKEPGSTNYDAHTQNICYFVNHCTNRRNEIFLKKTHCPIVLLELEGPYLSVSIACFDAGDGGFFLVDPVTTIPFLYITDDLHFLHPSQSLACPQEMCRIFATRIFSGTF